MTEFIKISSIKINSANPRIIRDERYRKLMRSVAQFPKMLDVRGIVVDATGTIMGGNQRYRAVCDVLKMPDAELADLLREHPESLERWERIRDKKGHVPANWIIHANDFTPDELSRFIIADNVEFGEHDWDMLANQWDVDELNDWGVDVPGFGGVDYSGKNQEIDTDAMADEMVLSFKFQPDQYFEVKAALEEIAETPESALLTLLENARSQVPV